MKTDTSTNIHVFRVNRATTTKVRDPPTQPVPTKVNSRTSLSAETKRLICEDHINNPKYTQEALATKYGCKRTTIAKIIKSKKRWLAIDSDAAIAKRFRQRSSRYPHVESALLLWVQKEFTDMSLVTDQMLRSQARQYAQAFHVDGLEYFKASSSWVSNFKQRYMNQTTKSNESSPLSPTTPPPPPPPPAPTLLLENSSIPSSSSITVVDTVTTNNNNRHHDLPPEFNQYSSQTTHELSVPVESFNVDPTHIAHQWALTDPEQNDLIPSNPAQSVIEMCEEGNEMESIQDNEEEEEEQLEDTYEDMDSPCYDVPHQMNSPDNTHPQAPPPPPHEPNIIETTTENTTTTTTKLTAKQHLEAALEFYTSQNESNQSMSANMIKLILQNDF